MKLTLISFGLAVFLIGVQSAPQYFDFNGMKGMIDTKSVINGVEDADGSSPQRFKEAEEIIKAMIYKQLDKKKAKKGAQKISPKAPAAPAPVEQEPVAPAPVIKESVASEPVAQQAALISDDLSNLAINWDEHPEARDLLNRRIPGGTASVDALITLIQERRAQN